MNKTWRNWAEKNGYRFSFGSSRFVETARNILEDLRSKNMINEIFNKEWLGGFEYLKGLDTTSLKNLVMVAIPKAAYVLEFEYKGKSGSAIIPPTYVNYRYTFNKILAEANSAFGTKGHRFELVDAPLKTLAVLTGLAKYGRNNVVYIPEMGSYLQLVGLVTDMIMEPESTKNFLHIQDNLMSDCQECSACLKACSTGAIAEDRILLHAEKCYTRFSENAGELPQDILPPSPECIIGCLKCQNICPMNRGKLNRKNTPFSLTEEETSFIVNHFDTEAPLWTTIHQKFTTLQLTEGSEIFARNFQRLVKLSFN
jgi:epoxyqueuosine reductase